MSLSQIQSRLVAQKNQTNAFGKYKYRSLEDINDALKPYLKEFNYSLVISDEIQVVGDRYYLVASATLYDETMKVIASNKAYAREPLIKKGMDEAQITGATSSYARKYALNGLFAIDDTKDADSQDNSDHVIKKDYKTVSKSTDEEKLQYKKEFINICAANGVDMGNITDFFNFCDPTINEDEKLKGNTIVQFLRSGDYFMEQVEAYKGWKAKGN